MNRPWMPLYVADYLADTAHLNAAQSGAYLHLIMHYWQTGNIPDDDAAIARIARMTPAEWRRARPLIQPFFSDGWKHKRIEFEMSEAARISAAGRKGGEASARSRRNRSNDPATIVERSSDEPPNDPPTKSQALQPQPPSQKEESSLRSDARANGLELSGGEPSPKKPRRAPSVLADDFALNEALREFANIRGYPGQICDRLFERFCQHAKSKGLKYADWAAAWRTWVLNQVEFDSRRPGSTGPPHSRRPDV